MTRLRRSTAGFALSEVLTAITIIIVAVLGLSLGTAALIRGNNANDNLAGALALAQDKMEELKAARDLPDENRCPSAGENHISSTGAGSGVFTRCWSVAPSALGPSLKQLDVTVRWTDSQTRRITLSSLVFVDQAS